MGFSLDIGFFGLVLLLLSWIPQTVAIIRNRKSTLDIKFSLLYTLGSLLLVYYSIIIQDWIFILLNSAAAFMSGISLVYKIVYK